MDVCGGLRPHELWFGGSAALTGAFQSDRGTDDDTLVGRTISSYEILERAGQGGMGRVYRARDRRLGRLVALKVLHPDKMTDPRLRRRLLREARIYSALKHPGVVAIYDIGRQEELDFIAMEWVSGRQLADLILAGPLPMDQVLDIAAQLAEALAAAHGAGIVHRDLKPSNVMVEDQGHVKVLDFGIAKAEGLLDVTTQADGPTLTEEGHAAGTLAYMSPEQMLGEPVGERTDIFSFGVVLYELLAGERPFRGTTQPAFVHHLLYREPEPLGERRQDVPPQLAALVLAALAKKPEDRPPNMAAIARVVRQLQHPGSPGRLGIPVSESQPSSRARPKPDVRSRRPKRPWRASLLAVASLSLLIALGIGAIFFQLPEISGLSCTSVHSDTSTTSPLPETAPAALAPTPYALYLEGKRFLERYDREGYVDAAQARFERAIRQSPGYAPAHVGLSAAYRLQFRSKRDPVWLDKAAQSARRALDLDPLLTDATVALARVEIDRDLFVAAKARLEKVLEVDPDNTSALAAIAQIALEEGKIEDAIDSIRQAIALRPDSWELYSDLGQAQVAAGDLRAAEEAFRKSLEIVPDNATTHRNLGAVLHYLGRYGEAVTELQRSITIQPNSRAYSNLGTAYYFEKSYREAAAAFEVARNLRPNYYLYWSNLGDAYRQLPEKQADAVSCFERAVQLLRPTLTPEAPDAPDPKLQSQLASYLVKAGRPSEALAEIANLEPLRGRSADIAYRATIVYELAGARAKALEALEIALDCGYPAIEVVHEPDLIDLREDIAYHHLMVRFDSR